MFGNEQNTSHTPFFETEKNGEVQAIFSTLTPPQKNITSEKKALIFQNFFVSLQLGMIMIVTSTYIIAVCRSLP